MTEHTFQWTNKSVRDFAGDQNPIDAITKSATEAIVGAIDLGWAVPPYDPVDLASIRGLEVVARDDIPEARTVPLTGDSFLIEFNPSRPRGRMRYSIAHEIAHTLFPDCAEEVRYRQARRKPGDDSWQLELLCNIAAAEFLMPVGSFPELKTEQLAIDHLLDLRKKYDVSTEAILIRVARLVDEPCAVFSAARSGDPSQPEYRLEYVIGSSTWPLDIPRGRYLPTETVVRQCTAIGFSAKGSEQWISGQRKLKVECVGLPPYAGSSYPRVAGIIRARTGQSRRSGMTYVRGDASEPRGKGQRIVAQIVNDKTPNWGGQGFANAVARKWPVVQNDFRSWMHANPQDFRLGCVHTTRISSDLAVFHMISQHGYGPSKRPRVRYGALESCLLKLASIAERTSSTIHMPRIGTGEAGGSWDIVEDLLKRILLSRGIQVTIYSLPDRKEHSMQRALGLGL